MFCWKCGNQLCEEELFCKKCGANQEISKMESNANNKDNSLNDKPKTKFWLTDSFVFKMFIANAIISFIGVFVIFFIEMSKPGAVGNGLMLLVLPPIALFCIIPHIIGIIVSSNNRKTPKKGNVTAIFIISLFSVISTYFNSGLSIFLIPNIALSIISFMKMLKV